jgi:HEAT repeat protein
VIDYLSGSPNLEEVRAFAKSHRSHLAECLLELRNTLSGNTADRLWQLALDLALVHDWCADTHSPHLAVRRSAFERLAFCSAYEPCRRVVGQLQHAGVEDSDPEIRLAAARGLAQSDIRKDFELVFRMAVRWNTLARAVLAEALRPYAVALTKSVIPPVLHSREDRHVVAALEIVVAWGRAVPLKGLDQLIAKGSRAVRVQALRALPLVAAAPDNTAAVVHAISDDDREVAREAIATAGRLHIEESLPALARCLRSERPELSGAAADALAAIPPMGWEILNEFSAQRLAPAADASYQDRKAARV